MMATLVDTSSLEGLSIQELIDRFPKVPSKIPPQSQSKDGKAADEPLLSPSPLNSSFSQEFISKDEGFDEVSAAVSERNFEEMMKRATRGVISSKEQAALFSYLVTLSATELNALQARVQDALTIRNPMLKSKTPGISAIMGLDKGFPMIDASRYMIDFGGTTCPLNTEVNDKIFISAKSGKIKFTFILPTKDPRYELRVTPNNGKLKNGKPPKEEIVFSIICKTTVHAKCVVTLDIEGGYRHFFTVNVKSEPSLFGVGITDLELQADEIFPGVSYKVPSILVTLRNYLVTHKGLEEEGIFRVAGDEMETATIKNRLNKGAFTDAKDIHAISNLIKIWFRELPQPVLNDLPPTVILQSEDEAKCIEEYNKYIKEPNRSVANWLMDLMVQTALLEEKNKMTPRSLSIVIGPNLFHSGESSQLSALESLRLSQQIVGFVFHILNHRLKMIKGS